MEVVKWLLHRYSYELLTTDAERMENAMDLEILTDLHVCPPSPEYEKTFCGIPPVCMHLNTWTEFIYLSMFGI